MVIVFRNTKKNVNMTEEDIEDFKINTICGFCENYIQSDKFRDHCHLTGKYRGPAHNLC